MRAHAIFRFLLSLLTCLLAATFAPHSLAQASSRAADIKALQSIWLEQQPLLTDDSTTRTLLDAYRQLNPQLSEQEWQPVAQEILARLRQVLASLSSTLDVLLETSMDEFSDEEISRLVQLMSDPVYRKYQQALLSPAVQQRMVGEFAKAAQAMDNAANEVLRRHRLRALQNPNRIPSRFE